MALGWEEKNHKFYMEEIVVHTPGDRVWSSACPNQAGGDRQRSGTEHSWMYLWLMIQKKTAYLCMSTIFFSKRCTFMKLNAKMEFKYIHESRRKAQTGQ